MNYVDLMTCAVRKAGSLVLSHFRSNIAVCKKSDGSIVTEVDLASELLLKQELSAIIPGCGFITEESAVVQGNEYTWVIDPIDGTKNFERGLPYFCISVALMYNQEVIAAVTYAPVSNDLFCAQQGLGAWLNDKKLFLQDKAWDVAGILAVVSNSAVVDTAVIQAVVTDSCIIQENRLNLVKASCKSLSDSVRFRVNGAAALDLAYAAAGMFDVVMFENLKWWDAAAGILLIQEAGGLVVAYNGAPIQQSSTSLIAGNLTICKRILSSCALKKEYV